jgi:hypothetical protein
MGQIHHNIYTYIHLAAWKVINYIIVYDDHQWRYYFCYILFFIPIFRYHIEMSLTDEAGVAVTLWTCNRNVLGSNPGRNTGYPPRDISWFSSDPVGNCWDNASIRSVHTYYTSLYANPKNVIPHYVI